MRFVGIWFDMDREVKRDYVTAKDSDTASAMIHALYPNQKYPAPALTVVLASSSLTSDTTTCNLA